MRHKHHQSREDRMHERHGMERAMHHKSGRYHQGREDREHEREGMEHRSHHRHHKPAHAKHHSHRRGYAPSSGFMTGHDEMVGRHDFAGMPPEVRMQQYPRSRMYKGGMLDDTMNDIDRIQTGSEGTYMKRLSNQK